MAGAGLPTSEEVETLLREAGQSRVYRTPTSQLELFQRQSLFFGLDGSHVLALAEAMTPASDGGLLVLPKTSIMGGYYSSLAIALQLLRIQSGRPALTFQRCPVFDRQNEYERTPQSERALSILEADTPGDYLVLPVAVRRPTGIVSQVYAQIQTDPAQWCLGPYELGLLLYHHPEWLQMHGPMELFCDGYLWRGRERLLHNRLGYPYFDLYRQSLSYVFDYVFVSSVAAAVATAR